MDEHLIAPEGPHGWIQFKGTDICMDIHCQCGRLSHVDGMFGYYVKCPECGQVYECNGHIKLIPFNETPPCPPLMDMDNLPDELTDGIWNTQGITLYAQSHSGQWHTTIYTGIEECPLWTEIDDSEIPPRFKDTNKPA